ncbi:glucosamine-6-phosphate isomerase, partial [Staphylococcus pseudintermedius]
EKPIQHVTEDEKVESFIKQHAKTIDNKGKLTLQGGTIDTKGRIGIPMNDTLLQAREIIVVVTGAVKAEHVKKLYEENGNMTFLTSALKSHRVVTVVRDEA